MAVPGRKRSGKPFLHAIFLLPGSRLVFMQKIHGQAAELESALVSSALPARDAYTHESEVCCHEHTLHSAVKLSFSRL